MICAVNNALLWMTSCLFTALFLINFLMFCVEFRMLVSSMKSNIFLDLNNVSSRRSLNDEDVQIIFQLL